MHRAIEAALGFYCVNLIFLLYVDKPMNIL